MFICTVLVIDTFLVSFYAGFNSRHVLIVDPSLPPLVPEHKTESKPLPGEKKPAAGKAEPEKASKMEKGKGKKQGAEHATGTGAEHEHKKAGKPKKSASKEVKAKDTSQ